MHICDFMTGDKFGRITVSSIHHSFDLRQLDSHGQKRSDMDHDTPAGMLDSFSTPLKHWQISRAIGLVELAPSQSKGDILSHQLTILHIHLFIASI